MRSRILSISADDAWRRRVAAALALLPCNLEKVPCASEGWEHIEAGRADLLILDLDLPGAERLSWFRLLRRTEAGQGLAAILVSVRRDEDEIAEAFNHRADDFVAKDCEPAELVARVRAVLRRRAGRDWREESVLTGGDVVLDLSRRRCLVRGSHVELDARQFELLEAFLRAAGRVLSRAYLLEAVWGLSPDSRTRAVDVAVSRLRRALGRRAGRWVETVERYGYRFRDPSDFAR